MALLKREYVEIIQEGTDAADALSNAEAVIYALDDPHYKDNLRELYLAEKADIENILALIDAFIKRKPEFKKRLKLITSSLDSLTPPTAPYKQQQDNTVVPHSEDFR